MYNFEKQEWSGDNWSLGCFQCPDTGVQIALYFDADAGFAFATIDDFMWNADKRNEFPEITKETEHWCKSVHQCVDDLDEAYEWASDIASTYNEII